MRTPHAIGAPTGSFSSTSTTYHSLIQSQQRPREHPTIFDLSFINIYVVRHASFHSITFHKAPRNRMRHPMTPSSTLIMDIGSFCGSHNTTARLSSYVQFFLAYFGWTQNTPFPLPHRSFFFLLSFWKKKVWRAKISVHRVSAATSYVLYLFDLVSGARETECDSHFSK
ncbi:hypothetical protein VTK56DRAFT_8660 [Thermocarpiscus australiensis]